MPEVVDTDFFGVKGAVIVAVPLGLHPRRLSFVLSRWADVGAHVAFTQLDQWSPSAEELAVCVAHRLRVSFAAYGSVILDPFRIISPQDISGWAQAWLLDDPHEGAASAPPPSPRAVAAPRAEPSSERSSRPILDTQPRPRAKSFDRISYIAQTQDEGSTS